MKFTLSLALTVAACGHFRHTVPEHTSTTPRGELQAKYDAKVTEVVAERDQASGWPSADDCDGTLWAGLECAAGVPGVKIELAELGPGVIGRAPGRDCYVEGRSASTTSQDMVSGYLWCAWRTKRLDLLETFATACESRAIGVDGQQACVIGEPYPAEAARVVMRPNDLGLLGRAIYAITDGSDRRGYRAYQGVYVGVPDEDYARHQQSLGMVLDGEIDTATPKGEAALMNVTPQEADQLRKLAEKDPADWTAAAGLAVYSGDFGPVTALLLDPNSACPTYTRTPLNCKVSWLFAARLVLDHLKEQ